MREFACLTAVILTPLRVEVALDGPCVTSNNSAKLAKLARLAKWKSMDSYGGTAQKMTGSWPLQREAEGGGGCPGSPWGRRSYIFKLPINRPSGHILIIGIVIGIVIEIVIGKYIATL